MTLKVLDINDPNKVLVDPPKPDWMKKQDKENADAKTKNGDKKKKKRWGKKKKDEGKSAEDTTAGEEGSGDAAGKKDAAKEEN